MSAPDPEGMSLLAKVVTAGGVIAAPLWGFFKLWDKKADKRSVKDALDEAKKELDVHRSYFKDIFQKLEDHARRDEDHFSKIEAASETRHRELMMHLLERK